MWTFIHDFLSRSRAFLRSGPLDKEFDEELESHISMFEDEEIRRGMTLEQARRTALLAFGNPTQIREAHGDVRGLPFLDSLLQDVKYALRTMRKSPAFTATALLALALGIGANAAIFTVIRAVLLQPLKYGDPDRLVYFSVENAPRRLKNGSFSLAQFEEMKHVQKSFTALGAFGKPENIMLSGVGEPEALKGARVSADFLDILYVPPLLGRSFLPEEDKRGGRPVAMISAGLWRRRFRANPNVVGEFAIFDATPYNIIGVLPEDFQFPFTGVDVWVTRPSEWSVLPSR